MKVIILIILLLTINYSCNEEVNLMENNLNYNLKVDYPRNNIIVKNIVSKEIHAFKRNTHNKKGIPFELKINYEIKNNKIKLYSYIYDGISIRKKDYIVPYYRKRRYVIEDSNTKRDLTKYIGKKVLLFTFDDGPSIYTDYLLNNLDKYDARVTFFVLGSRITNYKEYLIKSINMGNSIGNHTYNHFNLNILNNKKIREEIDMTNELIYKITGYNPIFIRPPYGNIKNSNMYNILWDIDPLDWKYKDKYKICNNIINNAHDGGIILLHDIYKSSIDGALLAMDKLKDEYVFLSLDEYLLLKNINLDYDKNYYSF